MESRLEYDDDDDDDDSNNNIKKMLHQVTILCLALGAATSHLKTTWKI